MCQSMQRGYSLVGPVGGVLAVRRPLQRRREALPTGDGALTTTLLLLRNSDVFIEGVALSRAISYL